MKEMKNKLTKGNPILEYTYKILFTIAIIFVYLCLPSVFGWFFSKVLGMSNTILMTSISSILTLLVLILIFNKTLTKDFYDFKKNWKKYIKVAVKCWAIGLGIMMFSNLIINYFIMGGNTIAGNEEKVREFILKYPVYAIISACIFAPICEEITFRLNFKPLFKHIIPFALTTAFIFGGLHVLTDFSNFKDLFYLIPYGALGFAFGYTYFKTNNIFSTMCMHFIHNTLTYSLIIITYQYMKLM